MSVGAPEDVCIRARPGNRVEHRNDPRNEPHPATEMEPESGARGEVVSRTSLGLQQASRNGWRYGVLAECRSGASGTRCVAGFGSAAETVGGAGAVRVRDEREYAEDKVTGVSALAGDSVGL